MHNTTPYASITLICKMQYFNNRKLTTIIRAIIIFIA